MLAFRRHSGTERDGSGSELTELQRGVGHVSVAREEKP